MGVDLIIGTRPNYIKAFPVYEALKKEGVDVRLIHTNQHYDYNMSKVFFEELGGIFPDIILDLPQGLTRLGRTLSIGTQLEKIWLKQRPDYVIVFGDVDSTFIAAFTAKTLGIPVAHVESGLRSSDMRMPEEVNRILADKIASLLFVTEDSGVRNLKKENVQGKVYLVGNTMIDTLVKYHDVFADNDKIMEGLPKKEKYCIVTFHRHEHFNSESFAFLKEALRIVSQTYHIVFPMHPRTKKYLSDNHPEMLKDIKNMSVLEPLGYIDFMGLVHRASLVVTDSGGIQEETTYLKIPCITLRTSTERPSTTEVGSNYLVPLDIDSFIQALSDIQEGRRTYRIPDLWEGNAAERIAKIISKELRS